MLVTLFSRFLLPWHLCDAEVAGLAEGTPPALPVLASPNVTLVHSCSGGASCCCHGPEQPQLPCRAEPALGPPGWHQHLGLPTQCSRAPSSHQALIHLISYRYTTGKIFLARSVLRQLKPNSSYWGISIHYQSCTKCSILSFFLLQAVGANNLQYFPEHREDGVI